MQVWVIVCKVGYVLEFVLLEYYMFGMMLGKDGKLFKICVGGIVKLVDLLDEVLECVCCLVVEKNLDMLVDELEKLVNVVGIGVVKYVDFFKNCIMDYIFDWDNMLVFEGNIVLYMQYVYMCVLFVFCKVEIDEEQLVVVLVIICEDCEV